MIHRFNVAKLDEALTTLAQLDPTQALPMPDPLAVKDAPPGSSHGRNQCGAEELIRFRVVAADLRDASPQFGIFAAFPGHNGLELRRWGIKQMGSQLADPLPLASLSNRLHTLHVQEKILPRVTFGEVVTSVIDGSRRSQLVGITKLTRKMEEDYYEKVYFLRWTVFDELVCECFCPSSQQG